MRVRTTDHLRFVHYLASCCLLLLACGKASPSAAPPEPVESTEAQEQAEMDEEAIDLAEYPVLAHTSLADLVNQAVASAQPVAARSAGGGYALALAVVRDQDQQTFYFGETREGSQQAPNETTLFQIGSITKTVTALLFARAVKNGDAQYSSPLRDFVPEAYQPALTSDEGLTKGSITLEQLAAHTSALPRNPPPRTAERFTPSDMYRYLISPGCELLDSPGASYHGSNLAYALLAHGLALGSGKDWETLAHDEVLTPLGMFDTRVETQYDATELERRAQGYHNGEEKSYALPGQPAINPAGSLYSTLPDMLKWLVFNMGLTISDLTDLLPMVRKPRFEQGGIKRSLDWATSRLESSPTVDVGGASVIWKTGATPGFRSYIGYVPRQKVGIVVLAASNIDTVRIGRTVLGSLIGIAKPNTFWPENVIPYLVDPSVAGMLPVIVDGLGQWAAATPLTFQPLDTVPVDDTQYIHFKPDPTSAAHTEKTDDGVDILFPPGTEPKTIVHEVGHALGLAHEQKRPDRDQVLDYYPDCNEKLDSFAMTPASQYTVLSPYDFDSIMQYPSDGYCIQAPEGSGTVTALSDLECYCMPMLRKTSPDPEAMSVTITATIPVDAYAPDREKDMDVVVTQTGFLIPATSSLSHEDVNVVIRKYERALGANDPAANFGAAMVTADFDADGYLDIAIGAPQETVAITDAVAATTTAVTGAGRVYLYKGTYGRPVAWRTIQQPTPVADAAFGSALAAADLDQDGRPELVIGAPNDVRAGIVSGAVYVFTATSFAPPTHIETIDLAATGLGTASNNDRFGASLVAGNFDGATPADLAIGAPGRSLESVRSGAVYVRKTTGSTSVFTQLRRPSASSNAGDELGQRLAIADFDQDGIDDLAVGSPENGPDAVSGMGSVWVFRNAADGATGPTAVYGPSGGIGDQFGADLQVGKFNGALLNGQGAAELVVGAPGHDTGSGRVYLYRPTLAAGVLGFSLETTLAQPAAMAADHFGSGLLTLPAAPFNHLVVGIPDRDNGSEPDSGRLLLFSGDVASAVFSSYEEIALPSGTHARFGRGLALGAFAPQFGSVDYPFIVAEQGIAGGSFWWRSRKAAPFLEWLRIDPTTAYRE